MVNIKNTGQSFVNDKYKKYKPRFKIDKYKKFRPKFVNDKYIKKKKKETKISE